MRRSARFRTVFLLGPAAVLAGALSGAADTEPPTCQAPAPKTIRTDPPQSLVLEISCTDASGASVSYVVDEAPEHGTLQAHPSSPGVYFYKPDAGYAGADSATFHASSVNGDSAPVVQAITVDPHYNRAPTCDTTAFTVRAARTREFSADCFDPDGDPLVLSPGRAPAHGTAEILTAGFAGTRYTAGTGYLGDDEFSYTVDDGHGGAATWELVATIVDHNQAPACGDRFTVARSGKTDAVNLAGACSDPDGDPLTLEVAEQPAHGTVSKVGPGWQIVTAAGFIGDDAFTMRASDGVAATTFVTKVRVVESGENPPECDDTRETATPGVTTTIQLRCFDRDLDVPRFEIREGPASGRLGQIDQATMTVPFTPDPGFTGTVRFVYGAVDADGASNSAAAEIVVTKDSTPPMLRVVPPARQALRTVLDRGLKMVVRVDEPATLTVRASVDARSARRLGLAQRASRPFRVGSATRRVAAGRTVVRVKLSRKARRVLRRKRSRATTVRLSASVTDRAGNRRERLARVVVR